MDTFGETSHETQDEAVGYEFTEDENDVIRRTGTYARIWGFLTMASGGLMILFGLGMLLSGDVTAMVFSILYGLLALIPVFVGLFFVRAGGSLHAVAMTAGNDIAHLVTGLDNLRKAFRIQVIAAVFWIGLAIVGVVLALVLGAAFVATGRAG